MLQLDPRLKAALTDQIMMSITFWLANDSIGNEVHDGPSLIHKTVFQVMCLIVPYMGEAGFDALSRMIDHYEGTLA